jgi:Vitamin K-dependent gamma-carboxylase
MKHGYELVPPSPGAAPIPARRPWARLIALYGSADPRSLALFRIALGALLAFDVLLKFPEAEAHLSNAGWLPNHFALFRPMSPYLFSVYFAFGTPLEVKLLLAVHLLVCGLLLVGYRTKLMQILALVLTTSLNSRNLIIENGGTVVLNLLVVWSVFLPLGRRFSVDALRASLAARRETSAVALNQREDPPRDVRPVVSLAVTALLLQWATIYFFNTLHKNGEPWRDGTAVHYFLQQDRLVTWFGAWLRGVLPLAAIQGLTFGTLLIEGVVPLLLLSPWRPHVTRLVALALVAVLHLSIDAVLQLGSFSWAMLVVFLALLPSQLWGFFAGHLRARRTPCVLHFDAKSTEFLRLCRLVKRFDALGLVTFRPLDAASPKKATKALTVSVEGHETRSGWEALLAIADALWLGRRGLVLLAPFVKKRVSRWLSRLAPEPQAVDAQQGLQALPHEADERAPPPSEARRLWQRLTAGVRELAVALLLVACGMQTLIENAGVPAALKPEHRPRVFDALIAYPRIFQGWSMFAPAPPMADGRLVIDGITRDGRRLDPLTGKPPRFEVHPAGEPRTNLAWGYFHTRIAEERFRAYWNGVRDFVSNHHKLSGRPQDALRSFEAYFVSERFAAPGQRRPAAERRKLFSGGPALGESSGAGARPKSKSPRPQAD